MPFPTKPIWIAFALGASAGAQSPGTDAERTKTHHVVSLHSGKDLDVRLWVRKRATPADREWLVFEFDNKTGKPIVPSLYARIEHSRHDLRTGRLLMSGGLADCEFHALHPQGKIAPVLSPGVTRVGAAPSDRAFDSLKMPPPAGWHIAAEITFGVQVAGLLDSSRLKKTSFSFEWVRPDTAGLKKMRARLHFMMVRPEPGLDSALCLGTLLGIEECSSRLSIADYFTGLDAKSVAHFRRETILHFLQHRFQRDERLAAWVLRRLRDKHERIVEDLRVMTKVWRPAFLPLLLDRYESGDWTVLWMLELHGGPHRADPSATKRLSKPWVARLPFARAADLAKLPQPVRREGVEKQVDVLRSLGMTRDLDLLPLLEPWLDCKLQRFDRPPPGFIPWHDMNRLCDFALEAILRILGEDSRQVYGDMSSVRSLAAADARRDRMIADVRARLAERRARQKR